MLFVRGDAALSGTFASSQSVIFDFATFDTLSLQPAYSNATTAGKTFTAVDTTADSVTMTAHGQVLGSLGRMTTTGGLPTGLSTSTDYFLIIVDANTVKFASSLTNAVAGTAIDLTTAGTGTQTFTPTTSSGNILKVQSSNDRTNWVDVSGLTATIATSTATALWDVGRSNYRYARLLYTPVAGQIALTVTVNAKADK